MLDEMHLLKMVVKFCTKLVYCVVKKMYCFRKNSDFPFSNQKIITLIISAYLPTRGNYEVDVFMDCIDQLYEIFQKFKDTHDILIGGDMNEESSLRI